LFSISGENLDFGNALKQLVVNKGTILHPAFLAILMRVGSLYICACSYFPSLRSHLWGILSLEYWYLCEDYFSTWGFLLSLAVINIWLTYLVLVF